MGTLFVELEEIEVLQSRAKGGRGGENAGSGCRGHGWRRQWKR